MRFVLILVGVFFVNSVFAADRVKVELYEVFNIHKNSSYKPVSFEIEAEQIISVNLFLHNQSFPSSVLFVFFDGKSLYFTEARGSKSWMASRATRHKAAIKLEENQKVEFENIKVKNTMFFGRAESF